ncbi:MAG: SCP2 sterol-binding domain-containing protein [Promethearchaeota archaeon]
MVKFGTQEWCDAYRKALNANMAYREAAGPKGFPPNGWEGDFIFVVEPSGPLDHVINIWIGLYHGECTGARILKEDEKYQLIKAGEKAPEGVIGVEFIYSANYDNWLKIYTKELDSTKALLSGQAKLQGDMAKVMRATRAAQEMTNTTASLDTDFL